MTAYSADDLIQQGMAEGVKTVLDKPLDIHFMLTQFSTVKKVLSKIGNGWMTLVIKGSWVQVSNTIIHFMNKN